MRTVVDGQLWLSYAQAFVTSGEGEYPEPEACFAGQTNGLLGAAMPGCLFLVTGMHTGEVPITVEVHDAEPPVDAVWEEVVEASFRPMDQRIDLAGLDSPQSFTFRLDRAPYRVRYCASGMDAAHGGFPRSAGEPEIDRYLLQFWPAPPAPDRVVRLTSGIAAYWHGHARSLPSLEEFTARRRREAEEAARRKAEDEERFARLAQAQHEQAVWGGPRPAAPLGDMVEAAGVARIDRALAEELAELPPHRRREIAHAAAGLALAETGLDGVDWIADAYAALVAGRALPEPFDAPDGRFQLQYRSGIEGREMSVPFEYDIPISEPDPHAMARAALISAANADPVYALFAAVQHAHLAFARERRPALRDALLARLRAT